ncbi:hypothetical protein PIB30_053120 [Stylosanthes scabra]|uniref:Gamma-interferon-inducible lysosomal thiol reductase n=1 Tax=Stylosanthes scabra TaxID=79078 RepID=A0ABU6WIG6_9FABA|nr:hypothetical protein [Stylosanthes scabra]
MIIVVAQALLIFMDESSVVVNSYPSGSHDGDNNSVENNNMMKVNLSVYYGSLCQPCSIFIVKNLQEIFYNGLIDIINLQLVPWANAYINKDTNNSIICQNGPDECELNSVESCAINILNTVDKTYALIQCFQLLAIEKRPKNWDECFSRLALPKDLIVNCHNTGNGTQEYENFTSYVCNSYGGSSMPEACMDH